MTEETPETLEMWSTLRAIWASGIYATRGALHRKAVELYGDKAPTLPAIQRRADRELWNNDAALSEEISVEAKKTAGQILSELGMGISRRMEILTEIITAPLEDHDQLKKIIMKVADNGFITDPKQISGSVRELRQLYSSGLSLSLKALQVAGQYAGDIATKESPAAADGQKEKDIESMTEEDKRNHIKAILRRLDIGLAEDRPVEEKPSAAAAA